MSDSTAYVGMIRDTVLQVRQPDTRWLSTGYNGGFHQTEVAYNMTVPDGWDRTDINVYVRTRRQQADYTTAGPALLTGVEMSDVRGAQYGSVVAYATVGLSNPAPLPMTPTEDTSVESSSHSPGTVNIILGTTHTLTKAAQANLLSVAAETKAVTLQRLAGIPGTTSDAMIIGCSTVGDSQPFAGSATTVGNAARVCVRDALRAGLHAHYPDELPPSSVADAAYGTVATGEATVFTPGA